MGPVSGTGREPVNSDAARMLVRVLLDHLRDDAGKPHDQSTWCDGYDAGYQRALGEAIAELTGMAVNQVVGAVASMAPRNPLLSAVCTAVGVHP